MQDQHTEAPRYPKLVDQGFFDGYQQAMQDVGNCLAQSDATWLNDDLKGAIGQLLLYKVTLNFSHQYTTAPEEADPLRELTPDQAAALRQYRTHHWPGWKPALEQDWLVAGTKCPSCKEVYHFLQQIRNQKGPRWLRDLDLELDG